MLKLYKKKKKASQEYRRKNKSILRKLFINKPNSTQYPARIFEGILIFTLTRQKRKTVAHECVFALRCRFKMIFNFLFGAVYQEVK